MSRLRYIVKDSDAIFFLNYTFKYRCILTVVFRALVKTLINTYMCMYVWLVMRHRISRRASNRLGCYLFRPQELHA